MECEGYLVIFDAIVAMNLAERIGVRKFEVPCRIIEVVREITPGCSICDADYISSICNVVKCYSLTGRDINAAFDLLA